MKRKGEKDMNQERKTSRALVVIKPLSALVLIALWLFMQQPVYGAQEGVGSFTGGITTPDMELYYEASSGGGYTNWPGQNEGTISFWFKPDVEFGTTDYATNKYFFEYYTPADQFRIYSIGDLLWMQNIANSAWAQGNASLAASGFNFNDWNLITITWYPDPTTTRNFIYINGQYTGTSFWNQGTPAGSFADAMGVGGRGFPGAGEAPCHGIIDEFEILNVGLSTTEIQNRYQQMASSKIPLSSGPNTLLLAHFDDTTTADFAV